MTSKDGMHHVMPNVRRITGTLPAVLVFKHFHHRSHCYVRLASARNRFAVVGRDKYPLRTGEKKQRRKLPLKSWH